MPRLLYIVARDRVGMYQHLRRTFADVASIEIVRDRRGRHADAIHPAAFLGDRRRRDIEDQLQGVGWAMVPLLDPTLGRLDADRAAVPTSREAALATA